MYSEQDVFDFIEEEDVRFIRLSYFDVFGHQKNVSIQPSVMERAFKEGILIDGSAIAGFEPIEKSDLFLRPDPNTLAILPWRSFDGSVIRLYCDIYDADGNLYQNNTRYLLKQAIDEAKHLQVPIQIRSEFEFYLFQLDENGEPTKKPLDHAGYMDIAPEDMGEDIRRQICGYLSEMGVEPMASHHEEGPGQNEIDFQFNEPLASADSCATFRWVVKATAQSMGLYADFSPKPIPDAPGSGTHIHIQVDPLEPFLAGILDHIRELTLFLNPTAASYDRLGEHKAPKYVTWDYANRSQLVRIPAGSRQIELRSPDGYANSYLAYTLLIYAGLDGVRRGLELMPNCNENLCGRLMTCEELPASFKAAKEIAAKSEWIRHYVPAGILEAYLER